MVDSYQTIYHTTIRTLDHFGIPSEFDENVFYGMIGHHFREIFLELNIDVQDIEGFISVYKKFYFDFIEQSTLYPGVEDILDHLKNKNVLISLLTTKAQDQADTIIDHFNLRNYFSLILGRRDGMEHKPSPKPLLYICRQLKTAPENTLMIGDTELDIRCGKNAGTKTCAVTFGYRNESAIKTESPDYILNEFSHLKEII